MGARARNTMKYWRRVTLREIKAATGLPHNVCAQAAAMMHNGQGDSVWDAFDRDKQFPETQGRALLREALRDDGMHEMSCGAECCGYTNWYSLVGPKGVYQVKG